MDDEDELKSAPTASQTLPSQPRFVRSQSVCPPSHIALPPPPDFVSFELPDQSPQYQTAPNSPALHFYTPPESPQSFDTPPPLHIDIPLHDTDDPFPTAELAIDLALDDDGLSTLEKIYLFSRSKATFHRVFITHALPDFLNQVSPQEAIEYVLPLLSGLAMDQDEQVKEALAAELVALIWWFFTHCKIIPDEFNSDYALPSSSTHISVQAFTPILGTLLLSANPLVGGAARLAIVELLSRLEKADDREAGDASDDPGWPIGSFYRDEREMFRSEIINQVVIGMGRLDVDVDDLQVLTGEIEWSERDAGGNVLVVTPDQQENGESRISSPRETQRVKSEASKAENVNPYFPIIPTRFHVSSSPASSAGSTPSPGSTTDTSSSSSSPSPSSSELDKKGVRSPSRLSISSTSASNSTLHPPEETRGSYSRSLSPGNRNHTKPLETRASSASPTLPTSPSEQNWATQDGSVHTPDRRQTNLDVCLHPAYIIRQDCADNYACDETEEDEQAAVGRLSSMSLIAAVTANVGGLSEETKNAFVKEVVRVGQDALYWVRREASFALGALAKVVSEEVVRSALLPLFDSLCHDSAWHVRHSALFALPAILSRMSHDKRRTLALDVMLTLSKDESPAVRSGMLEALGEVLYTFHEDMEGPPQKLIQLFLGHKEGQHGSGLPSGNPPMECLYNDPERPLICAFNYPAVALTLGSQRWDELREVYLDIARNRGIKVRRTLAASLGELAKIIGPENTERDLVGVWWDAITCEEEEVRTRAAESLLELLKVVRREVGESMVTGLLRLWDEDVFRGWREREGIAQALVSLRGGASDAAGVVVVGLLQRSLEDSVAAVREAGVSGVAELWRAMSRHPNSIARLRGVLGSLATSSLFRRRMTFIACQVALGTDSEPPVPLDDDFWHPLSAFADDEILGVRIGLARLVGSVSNRSNSQILRNLAARLSHDPSQQVQSYLYHNSEPKKHSPFLATFSRPPPPICDSLTFSECVPTHIIPSVFINVATAHTDPIIERTERMPEVEIGVTAKASIVSVPA